VVAGVCLNKLAELLPEIVGGSADLNPSTLTYLTCSKDFQKATPEGRNIRFGVREHGMSGISTPAPLVRPVCRHVC
jgi:transketolase